MKDLLNEMAEYHEALGDVTRLKLIKILASNKENTFCVSELAYRLNVSQPAISQHLKVLKNIGIVKSNRKGYKVFYSIDVKMFLEYRNRDIFNVPDTNNNFFFSSFD